MRIMCHAGEEAAVRREFREGAARIVRETNKPIAQVALHCQRERFDHLAERGAHRSLTVKGNQPNLHRQLAGLPWQAVPDAFRDTDRGHSRREIRALKALTISTGIDFAHAAQALRTRRRRRRLDQPKALHRRGRLRHHRPARAPSETGTTGRVDPRPLEHR
ncbi:hypothetical protein ACLQ22_09825 [Micromonospora sp. DT178]|uniref:hypothetical protein n=1 Tax=Micromonospora sp. DT178 TaxID=3393436 RepID=UPI003CE71F11